VTEGHPIGAVRFGDLRRTIPIARNFGFERGQPVDRHYIEAFLQTHASSVGGHVLEIGDDSYTRQFGGERVLRSDVLHVLPGNPKATIVADLSNAPLIPSNTFDCVILTQTLQLIYDVRGAVATVHRILKPGGVVLATFPGLSQTDDSNWESSWYWSFTVPSARRLFGDVFGAENVQAATHGNVLTAICFLHGVVTEELRPDELAHTDPAFPFLITLRAEKRAAGPRTDRR
jgi:SAM-dependent methyltransferase